MHGVGIGDLAQALLEEKGRTVRDDAVALHLTKTETTLTRSTLHRLLDENLQWAPRARVDLVVDHVLEALVIGWAEKDLRVDLAACVSVVEDLVAILFKAEPSEVFADAW